MRQDCLRYQQPHERELIQNLQTAYQQPHERELIQNLQQEHLVLALMRRQDERQVQCHPDDRGGPDRKSLADGGRGVARGVEAIRAIADFVWHSGPEEETPNNAGGIAEMCVGTGTGWLIRIGPLSDCFHEFLSRQVHIRNDTSVHPT